MIFGEIIYILIIHKKKLNHYKGLAFLQFASPESAKSAINSNMPPVFMDPITHSMFD